MENKNLTVWQRLSKSFGPDSLLNQDYPTFKFDKKVLLKTRDKAEYEKEKLQAQQTKFLAGHWAKIENNLYQQSVYYGPTRLAAAYDYESMEYTPEISAALDTYAEESTTVDQNGYMLQIYSESKRIKSILTDLFNNSLDINTNLPMWTRNTCKYGDNFVYLKLDPEKGVVGCFQLPIIEMERLERGMSISPRYNDTAPQQKAMKFVWRAKDMEFNTWEIAHFRLLGDDRKLPYGTSMLEKARRIWKQLVLAEDAMLIYRTSRAPERRVFKVFVGNMDDADIEPYVQRFANRFKRQPIVDDQTGNVDLRYNQMAVDQDYFVPVRDVAQASPIETLDGAKNLAEIADIEYIQKKLVTALRIPKAFLGFEEVVGDGKNLSLQDIRFARTINRIQNSMLAELNKIAIIHLFILGFEDEISNFTLGLSNPSTQADLLKIDVWKEKVLLYKDMVTKIEGIAPASASWAKKHILGFSDEDIKLDLQQQRIQTAIAKEIELTPEVIKHTGFFDQLDKLYGVKPSGSTDTTPTETESSSESGLGGDFGGGFESSPPSSPPPPPGPEPGGEAGVTPEGREDRMNLLIESDVWFGDDYLDLGKARESLGEMSKELDKLLNS
jgi:hypothetical protein